MTVAFGESKPGSSANIDPDINYNDGTGFSLAATVTIDPSLSGAELEAMVGHEGQHLADAQAFAATITDAGYFELSSSPKIRQTENKAFWITHQILESSNSPMYFRGQYGDARLGGKMSHRNVESAIKKILNGPLYADILERRLIPNYDYQP